MLLSPFHISCIVTQISVPNLSVVNVLKCAHVTFIRIFEAKICCAWSIQTSPTQSGTKYTSTFKMLGFLPLIDQSRCLRYEKYVTLIIRSKLSRCRNALAQSSSNRSCYLITERHLAWGCMLHWPKSKSRFVQPQHQRFDSNVLPSIHSAVG